MFNSIHDLILDIYEWNNELLNENYSNLMWNNEIMNELMGLIDVWTAAEGWNEDFWWLSSWCWWRWRWWWSSPLLLSTITIVMVVLFWCFAFHVSWLLPRPLPHLILSPPFLSKSKPVLKLSLISMPLSQQHCESHVFCLHFSSKIDIQPT